MQVADGYKQTEVGAIPEDWKVRNVGEVCVKVQDGNYGESYPKAHELLDSGIPFLTSKAIGKDGVLKERLMSYISGEKHRSLTKAHLSLNDILFTNRGASVGAIGFVDKRIQHGNIGPQLTLLRVNADQVNPRYFYEAMRSDLVQQQIVNQDAGSAMNFFGIGGTKKFMLPVPPLPEQRAIAEALSDVDALIQSLDALITKKRHIKQGTMQQLLTGQKRLPGFSGEWEEKTLAQLLKSYHLGGNYPNSTSQTNYPLMKMGNINRGKFSTEKVEYVAIGVRPDEQDRLLNGDILLNTRNTLDLVGKVAVWRNELPRAYFNSNLMRLEFDPSSVASTFLMNSIMNSRNAILQLREFATGTTSVAAIYTRDLLKVKVSLPKNHDEQVSISAVIEDMSSEITALEQKRDKTKLIKQGMMQELLTGKTRLV